MNVVFINSSGETFTPTQSGAVCTWIWEVLQAARRAGAEPWVITRNSPAAPYVWPRTRFVEHPLAPANRYLHRALYTWDRLCGWMYARQRRYFEIVAEAVAKENFQRYPLILQNDLELAVFLRKRFPGAVILHHAQNNNPTSWRFRKAFGRAVNVATAVTAYCARWNAEYYGRAVEVLFSGVDAERFSPAEDEPPGPPVINFVGRTDAAKAPDLLLKAALRLTEKTTRFSLQILGRNFYDHSVGDSYQQELRSLADRLKAKGVEVRMPGWITRDELPAELRRAHIHVVPARWDEPFGLTTLEGMSVGLATVASRTGGTPEVAGDGAMLFERGQEEELAQCLERLVMNEEVRRDYARRARARALELTWDRTWQSLLGLLAPVAQPQPEAVRAREDEGILRKAVAV